jgi:hypothetical protein
MRSKCVLTISLVLGLMAISPAAYAGSTITDRSYRLGEAMQSAQRMSDRPHSDLNSADDGIASSSRAARVRGDHASKWRYHGGPKSP